MSRRLVRLMAERHDVIEQINVRRDAAVAAGFRSEPLTTHCMPLIRRMRVLSSQIERLLS